MWSTLHPCYCCRSVTKSRPTLCAPMDCSTPGFPVFHYHPKFAQTHVHRAGDVIQPSHPLSSPSPPTFSLSSITVFSNESVLHIRWPKYWSFSLSPSNEYSGLISFKMDWLDLLVCKAVFFKRYFCREEELPVIFKPFCHQSGEPQMKMNISWLAQEIATRQCCDSWLSVLLLFFWAHLMVWRNAPPWHGCLIFSFHCDQLLLILKDSSFTKACILALSQWMKNRSLPPSSPLHLGDQSGQRLADESTVRIMFLFILTDHVLQSGVLSQASWPQRWKYHPPPANW